MASRPVRKDRGRSGAPLRTGQRVDRLRPRTERSVATGIPSASEVEVSVPGRRVGARIVVGGRREIRGETGRRRAQARGVEGDEASSGQVVDETGTGAGRLVAPGQVRRDGGAHGKPLHFDGRQVRGQSAPRRAILAVPVTVEIAVGAETNARADRGAQEGEWSG